MCFGLKLHLCLLICFFGFLPTLAFSRGAEPGCSVAQLGCAMSTQQRQKAEVACIRHLRELNQWHSAYQQTEQLHSRQEFFRLFREKFQALCVLKAETKVAVGKRPKPVKGDCGANGELQEISNAASTPEQLLKRQNENFRLAKEQYVNRARANISFAVVRQPENEGAQLQAENISLWGASSLAELPAFSTPIPKRGLFAAMMRLWEAELRSLNGNQEAIRSMGKNAEALREHCGSITGQKVVKGKGQGAPVGDNSTDTSAGNSRNEGASEFRLGGNSSSTSTSTDTSESEGEKSWASENKGLLLLGGLGVGAAAVVGAILYKKNQDKQKLSAAASAAVNSWENQNPAVVAELVAKTEEKEKNLVKFGENKEPVEIEVSGHKLKFFPPIATLLQDTAAGAAGDTIVPAKMSCPVHEQLAASFPILNPKDSFECNEAKEALKELFKGGTACVEVQRPVEFFASLDVAKVDVTKMNDLEEILKIYGPAMARMGLLGAFKKQSYYDRLSSVLVKLRIKSLTEKLEKRMNYFLKANKDLIKGGKCLAGTEEQKASAQELFGKGYQETLALLSELGAIESAGLKRAQEDRAKVVNAGFKRDELPFPAMSDDDRLFLSTALGGFLWRSRGGGVFHDPTNTNIRRTAFTLLPFEALGKLNAASKGTGLGAELWSGLFTPWGKFHDMGRLDGDKESDYTSMRERGTEQLSNMRGGITGGGFTPNYIDAAGPMMGDCYWYGWEKLEKVAMGVDLNNQPPYQHAIAGPTQWGELCTGGNFGFAMAASLLQGYK